MSPNQNQSQDPGQTAVPPPEFYQQPHWLYDVIMSQIEPDLTSYEIDHLDEKYAGETPEQRKERMEAYEKAYEIFEKAFTATTTHCEKEARQFHANALVEWHHKEDAQRQDDISAAEMHLDSDITGV